MIHVTGDLHVNKGVTLTIEEGTVVLVAARSDDQMSGGDERLDLYNPRDPPYQGKTRTGFYIDGSLFINGAPENPVIITSDAENPRNDDWGPFVLQPQANSEVEITRTITEYVRTIGIGSTNVKIQQSILRNMMECVVIGQDMCQITRETALDLAPTLTQNYIYNAGRHAVTVRTGAPTITHNVIRARPDMKTTGWEQGALALDFPTCAVVQHNYLDGGQPLLYQGEIFGNYHEYTQPKSSGARGICNFVFSYNTLIGSPIVLECHAGPWTIDHNNLLPVSVSDDAVAEGWPNDQTLALFAHDAQPEQSDICQFDCLSSMTEPLVSDTLNVTDNYWGTTNRSEIERLMKAGFEDLTFVYEPFAVEFIEDALPNWKEFEW
jgi:hypothetical protein